MPQVVAILGASEKPDRFANKAFHMLRQYGHAPIPVSPRLKEIEGMQVFSSLNEIKNPVDTLTMYVGPERSNELTADILALHPKRVIFNPGSENPRLQEILKGADIPVVEACTLVMLQTGNFD